MTDKSAYVSSKIRVAALLIGCLVFSQVRAAGDVSAPAPTLPNSAVVAASASEAPRVWDNNANDLQQLRDESSRNTIELATLKETVDGQSRLIEELKRTNNAAPQSSTNEVAALRTKMDQQSQTITQLETQLNDVKRTSGSNGDSNAGELSSLRQEISNLRSSVGRLESLVSSLSSKVK